MGTWAVDAFGNDDACEWAYELENVRDTSFIEETLAKATETGSDYFEAADACEVLAAAEVVARMQGHFSVRNAHTQIVDTWVGAYKDKPTPALRKKACAAIERVLSQPSELLELWQESDEFDAWQSSVLALKSRIMNTSADVPSGKGGPKKQSFFKKLFGIKEQ